MTIADYLLLRNGKRKARRKQLQEDFQHIRIQAYYSILPYLDKKDRKKTIDQLIPDIYEPTKEKPKLDYKALLERYQKAGAFDNGKQRANKNTNRR